LDDLLNMLTDADYVSGEEISRRLGVTRAAVWKRMEALREQGFVIESAGKKGYHLVKPCDSLLPVFVKKGLLTKWAGQPPIIYSESMTSTNIVLKQAAESGAVHGTVALCEEQTAGRGRRGRNWVSPKGQGLWVSLLLRPMLPPGRAQLITFAAAIAMAEAVEKETGLDILIKWPNDLVLQGKKICGILLELSGDVETIAYVVVGTGLNVGEKAYPPELSASAVSLQEVLGRKVERAPVLRSYLAAMEKHMDILSREGLPGILQAYERKSCTLQRAVRVSGGGEEFLGTAAGLDENGALLVKLEDGTIRHVLAGDVSVRGVMGYV
jgi:BirA family biotin operon repressor/biotin-[acetyl-CoA-carboxylase] ligase